MECMCLSHALQLSVEVLVLAQETLPTGQRAAVDGQPWALAVGIRSCSYADSRLDQAYLQLRTGLEMRPVSAGWDIDSWSVAGASQAAA